LNLSEPEAKNMALNTFGIDTLPAFNPGDSVGINIIPGGASTAVVTASDGGADTDQTVSLPTLWGFGTWTANFDVPKRPNATFTITAVGYNASKAEMGRDQKSGTIGSTAYGPDDPDGPVAWGGPTLPTEPVDQPDPNQPYQPPYQTPTQPPTDDPYGGPTYGTGGTTIADGGSSDGGETGGGIAYDPGGTDNDSDGGAVTEEARKRTP